MQWRCAATYGGSPDTAVRLQFVSIGDANERSDLECRAAGVLKLDFRRFEPLEKFPDMLVAAVR